MYTSVIAPSVISADSPRFLGFIPAAPTKASLLFDMLVSCASIQGISWLEASGAIAAENSVLRVIAHEAGLPDDVGRLLRVGRFGRQPVRTGGGARDRRRPAAAPPAGCASSSASTRTRRSSTRCGCWRWTRWWSTLPTIGSPQTPCATRSPTTQRTSRRWSARRERPTPASSTTWPASARSPASAAGGSTSTAPMAGRASSPAR